MITVTMTEIEFESLNTVLKFVLDNEYHDYQDRLEEDYNEFVDNHIYAHATKVKALINGIKNGSSI